MAGDVTTRSTIDGIAPRPPDAAELTRRYGATLRAMLLRALGDEARAERALPGLLHELARRAARPPAGVPLDDLVYGHARRWIAELANVPAARPAPPIEAAPQAPAAEPPPPAQAPPPPPRELRVQIPTQRLPEEPEPKRRGRFLLWLLAGLLLMAVTALATRFGLDQWGLLPDALRPAPPPATTATPPGTAPPLPDTAPAPPPPAATIEPPPPPEAPAPAPPAPLAEPPQAETPAPLAPPPAPAAAPPPAPAPTEPAALAPAQPSPPPALTPPRPQAAPPPPPPAVLPEPPQDEAPASVAPPPAPSAEPAAEALVPPSSPPAPAVEPAPPPAAEPPPAVSPNVRLGPPGTPRVYLHYTSDDANGAAIAEALAERIREQGVTVAGIRPVPFVIGSGSVRYYYDADEALARNLADTCNAEADPPLCARGALDFQSFTPPPLAGTVEIWIADRPGR